MNGWNPVTFHPWKRKNIIFQTIMFRFYVNLGVYLFLWFTQILPNLVGEIQDTAWSKINRNEIQKIVYLHGSFVFF